MESINSNMRAQVPASPCAACRMLRRRCGEKCVLAPYFPSNDLHKFATAHKIFGASNIIKLLQDLPRDQRADAVTSMVYEASARIRDPVYGCAGVICHMQSQLCELQSQLASAQAEILTMRLQQANLVALITEEAAGPLKVLKHCSTHSPLLILPLPKRAMNSIAKVSFAQTKTPNSFGTRYGQMSRSLSKFSLRHRLH